MYSYLIPHLIPPWVYLGSAHPQVRGNHESEVDMGYLQGANIPYLAHPLDDSSKCGDAFQKMLATHPIRCEGSGILVVVVGDGLRSGVLFGSPRRCSFPPTSSTGTFCGPLSLANTSAACLLILLFWAVDF